MTERKKPFTPTKSVSGPVDVITGWLLSIKGLMVAIGGAVLVALTLWPQITGKLADLGYTPAPCLQVDPPMFPATVEYTEWDHTTIKLKGRNNCSKTPGLYVTFAPRTGKSLLRLRLPHEELAECKGLFLQEPTCWDTKKNFDKGDWEWNVLLPPLVRVDDPPRVEKIWITWAVYDSDAPTKPPILTDNAPVEVRNPARDAS